MWSHYADSHKGICLEFDINRGGFFYNNLLPVQYRKRYPKFELSDYQDEENMMFTMHQQAICTKSVLWKYEKEWRVIADDGCGQKAFDKLNFPIINMVWRFVRWLLNRYLDNVLAKVEVI